MGLGKGVRLPSGKREQKAANGWAWKLPASFAWKVVGKGKRRL